MPSFSQRILAVLVLQTVGLAIGTPAARADDLEAAVRQASKAYAEAFNKGDYEALANQWTSAAELSEGGGTITGRERIVESLKKWRERNPKSTIEIDVAGIDMLGESAARVRGRMRFTEKPGDPPHTSTFESLRVLEAGSWKLAVSRVGPSATALLDELSWLAGTWQGTDSKNGTTFEMKAEKVLGGRAMLVRSTIRRKPATGSKPPEAVEAIEIIQADSRDGAVRCWVVDSTGARAEGFFDSDGTSFNRTLTGVSGEAAGSSRVQWVQVLTPTAADRMILHAIDRVVEGRPLPDADPITFRKIR